MEQSFEEVDPKTFFVNLAHNDPRTYASCLMKYVPNKVEAEVKASDDLVYLLQEGMKRVEANMNQPEEIEVEAEVVNE